jgi:bifunctional non-homologous end joining protein LigD
MLATLVPESFDRPGWAYEEKYDADRILAYKEDNRVRLLSRNEKDRADKFPRIAAAIRALKPVTLLLDGEVVIFDRKGISRFQLLQQNRGDPVYAIFDCLFHEGKDLRREPLSTRRAVMERSIRLSKLLLPSRRLATNGLHAFRIAQRRGYEGLVAKDLSSPYVEVRSTKWLKVKVHQEDEFVIAGFTRAAGSRQYFGALRPARTALCRQSRNGIRSENSRRTVPKISTIRTISTCAVGSSAPEGRGFSSPSASCPDLVPRMDG